MEKRAVRQVARSAGDDLLESANLLFDIRFQSELSGGSFERDVKYLMDTLVGQAAHTPDDWITVTTSLCMTLENWASSGTEIGHAIYGCAARWRFIAESVRPRVTANDLPWMPDWVGAELSEAISVVEELDHYKISSSSLKDELSSFVDHDGVGSPEAQLRLYEYLKYVYQGSYSLLRLRLRAERARDELHKL